MLARIAAGRTDLVFEYVAHGGSADHAEDGGVSLMQWCAYYGDVSAIRLLLSHGASIHRLGSDLGINEAAFHGHWRLCEFLIEHGANANIASADTGETPLHSALGASYRREHDLVVQVLLTAGANPNCATAPNVETGAFMRDARTKGEIPLHRAAAFASEETVRRLMDAGAKIDAKDANGDTPLSWASWHRRPDSVLRRLCHGPYSIRPDRESMEISLLGKPTRES